MGNEQNRDPASACICAEPAWCPKHGYERASASDQGGGFHGREALLKIVAELTEENASLERSNDLLTKGVVRQASELRAATHRVKILEERERDTSASPIARPNYGEQSAEWRAGYDEAEMQFHEQTRDLRSELRVLRHDRASGSASAGEVPKRALSWNLAEDMCERYRHALADLRDEVARIRAAVGAEPEEGTYEAVERSQSEVARASGPNPVAQALAADVASLKNENDKLRAEILAFVNHGVRLPDDYVSMTEQYRDELRAIPRSTEEAFLEAYLAGQQGTDFASALARWSSPCASEEQENDHASRDGDGEGDRDSHREAGADQASGDGDASRLAGAAGVERHASSVSLRGGALGAGDGERVSGTVTATPSSGVDRKRAILLLGAELARDHGFMRATLQTIADVRRETIDNCAAIAAEIAELMENGAGETKPGERLRQVERMIRAGLTKGVDRE